MHEIGLCWPEIFKTSEQNNIHDPGRNFRENFVCQTLFLAQYLRLIFPLRNGAAGDVLVKWRAQELRRFCARNGVMK
jgi:hypothetical protein